MKRGGPLKRLTPLRSRQRLKTAPGKPSKRRTKSDLQKLKAGLWELCRLITRARYGNICYTCGKGPLAGSNWQTGHFISSSICSVALRYDLDNLRPQCYNCNINKSGNWIAFEEQLVREHGNEYVLDLKRRNRDTKGERYDTIWYQVKIEEYKRLNNPVIVVPHHTA